MKKLVMMCAIVAAAISVHAASIKWGGAIAAEDGETALASGLNAYLLYSDSAFSGITSFNADTKTTNAGGTLVDSHELTSTDVSNYAFAEVYENSDYSSMNGYYAMVLVNGDNMYYNTFSVSEFTSATTPMQDKTINAAWDGSDYLGDPARKGTVTGGVPEPTSGLLLLIGGAMLALRRKQK